MALSQPPKSAISDISARLIEERLRVKISQKALAEALNVAPRTVGRWELGTPIPSDKIVECFHLGLDMGYVLFGPTAVKKDSSSPAAEAVDVDLLIAIIARVEDRVAREALRGRTFSAEDKGRAIGILYENFKATGQVPGQHDAAVLSAVALVAG